MDHRHPILHPFTLNMTSVRLSSSLSSSSNHFELSEIHFYPPSTTSVVSPTSEPQDHECACRIPLITTPPPSGSHHYGPHSCQGVHTCEAGSHQCHLPSGSTHQLQPLESMWTACSVEVWERSDSTDSMLEFMLAESTTACR